LTSLTKAQPSIDQDLVKQLARTLGVHDLAPGQGKASLDGNCDKGTIESQEATQANTGGEEDSIPSKQLSESATLLFWPREDNREVLPSVVPKIPHGGEVETDATSEKLGFTDPAGDTDIVQMPPGRVKPTAGTEAVRSLRLSDKGVVRWYTDCCWTPIGNTAASPRFPVIAVIHSFMVHQADGRSWDEVLGPPLCRIYERSAVGPLPPNAPALPSLWLFAHRASKIIRWWLPKYRTTRAAPASPV
jgi:hypothetical protein